MKKQHIVKAIEPGSVAMEMGIIPGDALLSINGHEVEDIFDYRYLIADETIILIIQKQNGEEWELDIEKDADMDLGIEFENALMSDYKSCSNKCIFCFIDQMPPGMRDTLYFKDDDSRLSFLQGNYITLTNMKDKDINRIIKMQLAPINISIHTTNPDLRCKMLHNRFAGEKLHYLKRLYEGHVEMNGQIVCCRGVNDGEELRHTIEDLIQYLPFMRSVSVVPAGLTKYREGLYPLELFSKQEACQVIDLIESYQEPLYNEFGLHFIHASDEWYLLAERDFPKEENYDGYIQLENGVGMMRLFINEVMEILEDAKAAEGIVARNKENQPVIISLATGMLAYPVLCSLTKRITKFFPWIKINVIGIRNEFFGETITVSGLVTGTDLIQQILEYKRHTDLGERVLIPGNMLRSGEEVFLDDITLGEVSKAIGVQVKATASDGKSFVESICRD